MKISDLIGYLEERLQDNGDLDIGVHDTATGDICAVDFDEQIAIQCFPGTDNPVLAFSPDGAWSNPRCYLHT